MVGEFNPSFRIQHWSGAAFCSVAMGFRVYSVTVVTDSSSVSWSESVTHSLHCEQHGIANESRSDSQIWLHKPLLWTRKKPLSFTHFHFPFPLHFLILIIYVFSFSYFSYAVEEEILEDPRIAECSATSRQGSWTKN